MFRRLMTATGMAVVLSAPAFAQVPPPPAPEPVVLGSNILQFGIGVYQGATAGNSFFSGGYTDPGQWGTQNVYVENYGSAIQSIVDQGQLYKLNTMEGVSGAPGILISPAVVPSDSGSGSGSGSGASSWGWGVGQVAGLYYGGGSNNSGYLPSDISDFISQFSFGGSFGSFGTGYGPIGPAYVQAAINTNFGANRDTPLLSTVIVGGNQSAVNIVNSAAFSLAVDGGDGLLAQTATGLNFAVNVQQAIAYNGEAIVGRIDPTVQQAAVQINSASINLEGDASAIQNITLSRTADIYATVANYASASSLANSLPTIDPTVRNIAQTAQFSLNQLSFTGVGSVNLKMGDGNATNAPYNSSVNVKIGNAATAFTGQLQYNDYSYGSEPVVHDYFYRLVPGVGAASVTGVSQLATFSYDAIRAGTGSHVNLNLGTDQNIYVQDINPGSYNIGGINDGYQNGNTNYYNNNYPVNVGSSDFGPGSFVAGTSGYEQAPFDAVLWDRGFQSFFAGISDNTWVQNSYGTSYPSTDSLYETVLMNFITAQTGLGNATVSGVANSYMANPNDNTYRPYFTQAYVVEGNTIAAGGTLSGFVGQGIEALGTGPWCGMTNCSGSYSNLAVALTQTGTATISNVSQYGSQQYNTLAAGAGIVSTTTSADSTPVASQLYQAAGGLWLVNSNVQIAASQNGGASINGAYQQSSITLNSVNAPSIAGASLAQVAVGVVTSTYNTLGVVSSFNGSISGTQVSQSSINSIVSPARPAP